MSINAQPFEPSFKLVDNLQDGQILIYDVSENAFVNAYGDGSGTNTTPVTTVMNLGTGITLSDGVTGNALELKTLVAGSGITLSDNTDSIVISVNQVDQIQGATNLGTGAGVLASITVDNDFQFKSIAAGSGIGIADDGSTITLSVSGSLGQGLYLEIDNNLSDLSDKAAARTSLDVFSKAESQGKFVRTDGHSIPDYDKTWDIGSSTRRFNDIYAETLQGTAVLANNLTISGQPGDLLAYDGQRWIPIAATAGETPQMLSLDGTTLTLSQGNSINLDFVEADIEGITVEELGKNLIIDAGWTVAPETDGLQSLGTPTNRWAEVYLSNASVYLDNNTLSSSNGNLLWNGQIVQVGTDDLSQYVTQVYVDTAESDAINAAAIYTDAQVVAATTGLASELYVDNELSNSLALYATLTYVDDRFTTLLGAAPEALDTLKELSDALGGDANFSATVTNQLALKANTADLATIATTGSYSDLIGAPTTVSSFTNDTGYLVAADISSLTSQTYVDNAIANATTDMATTAFVNNAITTATGDFATELYVNNAVTSAVANVVDLAPETLDTLNELAAAIGDDANFVTTINSSISAVASDLATEISTTNAEITALQGADVTLQNNIDTLSNSLATVATTGNYSDLNGVPTNVSAFTNDANYITLNSLSATGDISYDANTGTFSYTAPTDISQLTDTTNLLSDIDGLTSDSANAIVYLDTGWHFLPSTDVLQDLGSATNRFRDLYLSGNTIYMEEATLSTDGVGNLFFNGKDVFDFTHQKNKPRNLSEFVNDIGFVSDTQMLAQIQSDLANLTVDYSTIEGLPDLSVYETTANVDAKIANVLGTITTETLDTIGELANAINNDPDYFNTISSGLDAKANTIDLSTVATTGSYNDLADLPIATAIERFKVNYATDGSIQSITDATGGIVATVTSAAGGLVEFTFTGYAYPPTGILIYGYAYATNEYVVTPVTADMTTRKLAGGGVAGAPTAFGALGSSKLTLKLAEADTGASRSFGTTTHAWVMFTMVA